jgi:hypothetical protein
MRLAPGQPVEFVAVDQCNIEAQAVGHSPTCGNALRADRSIGSILLDYTLK